MGVKNNVENCQPIDSSQTQESFFDFDAVQDGTSLPSFNIRCFNLLKSSHNSH